MKKQGIVIQYATSNLDHFIYAKKINKFYCKLKNINYIADEDDARIKSYTIDKKRSLLWYKPSFLLNIINEHDPEYVLYLDSDAIFLNFDAKIEYTNRILSIEEFIHPVFDITISEDASNPSKIYDTYVNTGSMLIKNTDKVKKFLIDWDKSSDLYPITKTIKTQDQLGFCLTLDANPEFKNSTVKILTDKLFNSQWDNEKCLIFHAWKNKNKIKEVYDRLIKIHPEIEQM
jgi:hypothetical protein